MAVIGAAVGPYGARRLEPDTLDWEIKKPSVAVASSTQEEVSSYSTPEFCFVKDILVCVCSWNPFSKPFSSSSSSSSSFLEASCVF